MTSVGDLRFRSSVTREKRPAKFSDQLESVSSRPYSVSASTIRRSEEIGSAAEFSENTFIFADTRAST
jgi:hypothetical protein